MVSGVTQLLSLFITLKVKGKVAIFLFEHTPECMWGMEVRLHPVFYGSAAGAAEQLWMYWKRNNF
jgi:hypothetical protein